MNPPSSAQPEYHPDLTAAAKRAPRVVVRNWTVPVLNLLTPVMFLSSRSGERTDLESVSVFMYRPAKPSTEPGPAVLWIHGGGMVIGDARQDAALIQRFVDELGIPVCSVQYRLASKHPFPAPLNDCKEALDWLASQPDVDPSMVTVLGISGGGCLAAGLCQLLREENAVNPCLQVLVYPMLDDRSSDAPHPHEPLYRYWDRGSNRIGWDRYLRGHDRSAPPRCAVPARADALQGLPPTWLGVGTLDLFHDEDVAYANALDAAGVPIELVVVRGGFHGFDNADPDAPISVEFAAAQMRAIRGRLAELGWTP